MILLTATGICISGLWSSCAYKKNDLLSIPCDTSGLVSFAAKVEPILKNNCFSCHNNSLNLGNVSLEGYDNIKNIAADGRLFGVINHTDGFPQMPLGGSRLDDCSIADIKKWIDSGKLNN